MLCVSELATNAVLHSASRNPGGTFTVRAAVFDDCVRIEVEDNGGAWDEHPHRDNRSHGLDIVRELAADCGSRRQPVNRLGGLGPAPMAPNMTTMTDPALPGPAGWPSLA